MKGHLGITIHTARYNNLQVNKDMVQFHVVVFASRSDTGRVRAKYKDPGIHFFCRYLSRWSRHKAGFLLPLPH